MKIINIIEIITKYVTLGTLVFLIILIFGQIVARELLGIGYPFVGELSMILLSWLAFISAAYSIRVKGHVALDLFITNRTEKTKKIIRIMVAIILLIFTIFITYQGWQLADRQMGLPFPILGIPRGVAYYALPVGTLLMTLFIIDELTMYIKQIIEKK